MFTVAFKLPMFFQHVQYTYVYRKFNEMSDFGWEWMGVGVLAWVWPHTIPYRTKEMSV